MDSIKVRQCALAPELVGHNVPICPFPNPETGHSHFIIRLTDRTDPRFMVDLLFRDQTMYFIAFRRHRILSEAERLGAQGEVNAQIKVGPGTWYRFNNENLPACLNTLGEGIGLCSGHTGDKTTLGGSMVLRDILIALSRYEDNGADEVALKKATQRVMAMFSEASRFRSVYNEIARRIRRNEPGEELSLKLWKFIHSWDVLSLKVYEMRLRGTIGLDTPLPIDLNLHLYGFDPEIHTTMTSLIGPQGELMLLHCNKSYLIEEDVLEQRMAADGSANVAEPN